MASATTLMSNPSGVLQPAPSSGTQLPSSSSAATSSSDNGLNANSFLTLLTTQLQAQDPLNPMDPSQMVDQLTQINSLQQLIQIQSDLQTHDGHVVHGQRHVGQHGKRHDGIGSDKVRRVQRVRGVHGGRAARHVKFRR